jgi:cell division protein FtsZ
MHEINSAAETITNAADADANIIFGATINPDLEGEVIVTVVATGFDASYFTKRKGQTKVWGEEAKEDASSAKESMAGTISRDEEKEISSLDMSLEDASKAPDDFKSDSPMPNIWAIDDEHDEQTNNSSEVTTNSEEELQRPSFLRRLTKRYTEEKSKEKDPTKEENSNSKNVY